tara:strand:+ start:2025 stop:2552 length:528 start_codon:yes stop_codon:yes gene_type:complete
MDIYLTDSSDPYNTNTNLFFTRAPSPLHRKRFIIFETMTTTSKQQHIGRKVARIRELRGMKQESLAEELGISQQGVSSLENSEKIEADKLETIAKILGVTKEAIENFSEDAVINYFNSFYDNSSSQGNSFNQGMYPTFNPLDKLVEAYEENKKLYERLVQAEKDKVSYLEKLLNK